jgi:hypothetical protein
MITNRQQAFKPLLQWLWAVHHKDVIPITPIQQSPGEREQQKKIVTHQIHIFLGLSSAEHPNTPSGYPPHPGTTPDSNAQLSSTVAKIADLFQQQRMDATETKEHKEPGWSLLNNQSKLIILRAMTMNSLDMANNLTSYYTEFYFQCTAFNAHNYLLDQLKSHGRAHLANSSHKGMLPA